MKNLLKLIKSWFTKPIECKCEVTEEGIPCNCEKVYEPVVEKVITEEAPKEPVKPKKKRGRPRKKKSVEK